MIRLVFYLCFTVAFSFASERPLQVQRLQTASRQVSAWVWLDGAVSVARGSLQLKNPLPLAHPELLSADAYGQTLLVPQIGKGKIDYRLIAPSGASLGKFTLLGDNDLPLPAAQVDPQNRLIYFLQSDGRISARDYRGRPRWEKHPPRDYVFTYENTYFSHRNAQRQILFTAYSAPLKSSRGRFDTIIREYNSSGYLIYREVLKDLHTLKAVYDDKTRQKLLMVSRQNHTPFSEVLLLDEGNSLLWKKDLSFRQALFLPDKQILLMQKRVLFLLEGATGKTLHEFRPAAKDLMISDVLYAGEGDIVVVSGKPFYSAGKLRFADPTLTVINKRKGGSKQVTLNGRVYLPRALYLTEGGEAQIGCRDGLYQIGFR